MPNNPFTDRELDSESLEAIDDVIKSRDIAHGSDDNTEIKKLLDERLAIGRKRYGHGIRVHDDTREWGTKENSWTEMGLEEVLDLSLYLAAQIIRLRQLEDQGKSIITPHHKTEGWGSRVRRWLRL